MLIRWLVIIPDVRLVAVPFFRTFILLFVNAIIIKSAISMTKCKSMLTGFLLPPYSIRMISMAASIEVKAPRA